LEQVMTYRYQGKHYDCGSKVGFLEATVAFGLKHPEVGSEFRDIMLRMARQLLKEESSDFVEQVEAPPALLKAALKTA
jgi:UTP--glucose-1-phosphate uridylyltransferase